MYSVVSRWNSHGEVQRNVDASEGKSHRILKKNNK